MSLFRAWITAVKGPCSFNYIVSFHHADSTLHFLMQILCQCFYESFWKLLLHLTPAKDSLVSKSHLEFTHLLFLQPPFREGQPADTMGTNCQEFSCTTLRGKYLLMEIKKQVAAGFEKPGICAFLSHL